MSTKRSNPLYQTPAWKSVRRRVLERDAHRCRIGLPGCKVRATSADHVVELADGGAWYDPENLQAACGSCNTAKGNRASMRRLRQVRTW